MFDEKDIEKMEAFAMFCGIGIHNTKTYESTCKLMAKQVKRNFYGILLYSFNFPIVI